MEEKQPLAPELNRERTEEEKDPREIVEVYRAKAPREVVEHYVRPLPKPLSHSASVVSKQRRKRGLWIFLALLALLLLLAAGAWYLNGGNEREGGGEKKNFWEEDFQENATDEEAEITIPTYPFGEGAELNLAEPGREKLSPQEIYQAVNPAVVLVAAELEQGASVGTGVIFRQDGYLITNHHVVAGGRDCIVMLDNGMTIPAAYVAGDAVNDLAVLKVERSGLPTARFGDSDRLTVGDKVYAIGNPLGMELRGTFTDGIVSAIDRYVKVDGRTMNLIQTNAALNSGNSGGPLVDEYGQVVGINVIKMSSEFSSIEGLGFAIPSSSVERLVNDLLTYGEVRPEPQLGMSVLQLGQEVQPGLSGLEVVEVLEGGSADRAGMEVGDFILDIRGIPVTSSRDVFRIRRQCHLGDQLPMTLWRDGERVEIVLELDTPVK